MALPAAPGLLLPGPWPPLPPAAALTPHWPRPDPRLPSQPPHPGAVVARVGARLWAQWSPASPPRVLSSWRLSAPGEGTPHPPEASSTFVSTSNSAVMWVTSLDGDFRPRRLFLEESHLRVTKVMWQFSGQGRGHCGKGGRGRGVGSHLARESRLRWAGEAWARGDGALYLPRRGPHTAALGDPGVCPSVKPCSPSSAQPSPG